MKDNIIELLKILLRKDENQIKLMIEFEPFSALIINELQKIKSLKEKQKLFLKIFNDEKMLEIPQTDGLIKQYENLTPPDNWENTLNMAKHLARKKIPVAFLPEYEEVTSADAITKIKGKWRIIDFKCCITTNWNTIKWELNKAFHQAQGAVIQLNNADTGQFIEAIEYFKRNRWAVKDLILMNEYGKFIELDYYDIYFKNYKKKIKGLL